MSRFRDSAHRYVQWTTPERCYRYLDVFITTLKAADRGVLYTADAHESLARAESEPPKGKVGKCGVHQRNSA